MTAEELWDYHSELIGTDLFDLERIAGKSMIVSKQTFIESLEQYAKHHAGLAFDAGIDWYESEIERAAHQENRFPDKDEYLNNTFK